MHGGGHTFSKVIKIERKVADLDGGYDELWVALQRLQHSKEDAGHDGCPNDLIGCCLEQHSLCASGVLRLYVFVQHSVPPVANRPVQE